MPSRPPFRLTVFVCCAASIGFSAVLGAHDTWLLANRGNVPVGGTITLDMSSGGRFPASETAILPARVAQAQWRLAGASLPLQTVGRQAGALRFRATLTAGGVATLWVSLHPKVLTLKPSLVQEYTAEIGAPPEILEGWQRATDKTWRERYSKHAKSFVRVGTSAATDTSWSMRTGQPYELVPLQNPTALAADDTPGVLALRCGQPPRGVTRGGCRRPRDAGILSAG